MEVLTDLASDVAEADRCREQCQNAVEAAPSRLRRSPEDRTAAETEVRREARVKDLRSEELSFRRLVQECDKRQQAVTTLPSAAKDALLSFSAFLKSPGVADRLEAVKNPSDALAGIVAATSDQDAFDTLLILSKADRKSLAKDLKRALGEKTAKVVNIESFALRTTVIWEKSDIDSVVAEFREYLYGNWEDGHYIQIE